MGLKGVECVMLGYNTPVLGVDGKHAGAPHLTMFQNHLSMQAGAYQNATWVCAAAKAGDEEGVYQIGGSCIIAPTGEIVAQVRLGAPVLCCLCVCVNVCVRARAPGLGVAARCPHDCRQWRR